MGIAIIVAALTAGADAQWLSCWLKRKASGEYGKKGKAAEKRWDANLREREIFGGGADINTVK